MAPFPKPAAGLVIRYAYLWRNEALAGRSEGVKDRPCAVVLVTRAIDASEVVTVLPVTRRPPSEPDLAVEIPRATKRRLGLDNEQSWVVLTEANRFAWPGPDVRPSVPGDAGSVAYGYLPAGLYETIRSRFAALLRDRRAKAVIRTE